MGQLRSMQKACKDKTQREDCIDAKALAECIRTISRCLWMVLFLLCQPFSHGSPLIWASQTHMGTRFHYSSTTEHKCKPYAC